MADAEFLLTVDAGWTDPADDARHLTWAEATWRDLRAADGAMDAFYPAFPGFADERETARMVYGANRERLADLKARYDPDNVLGTAPLA